MRSITRLAGLVLLCAAVAAGRSTTAPAQADGAFGTDRNCCDHGALSQVPSTSKRNLLGSDAGAAPGGLLGSKMGRGSGSRYRLTPTQAYQGRNSEPCRTSITQAVVTGQQQRSEDAACRRPNAPGRRSRSIANRPPAGARARPAPCRPIPC